MPYRADKDAAEQRVKVAQEELERANLALVHWYPGTPPKPVRWWKRAWLYVTKPFRRRQEPSFSDRLHELMHEEAWIHGASTPLLKGIQDQVGLDDGIIRPPPPQTVVLPHTLSKTAIAEVTDMFKEAETTYKIVTRVHTRKVQ